MPFTPVDEAGIGVSHGFVTISDSADNAVAWRYLYISVAGTLKITAGDGTVYVTPTLTAGMYFMGTVKRVWATGGTLNAAAATQIIGFY